MRLVPRIGIILLAVGLAPPVAATPGTASVVNLPGPGVNCEPWSIVRTPPGETLGITGIDGPSDSDFWATVAEAFRPEILHWNGAGWTQATVLGRNASLNDLDVISPTDAWAVGSRSGLQHTEAFRWDGSVWNEVPVPSPHRDYDYLDGVSATSSSDVWAVGTTGSTHGLIIHFDGTRWSVVPHPGYPNGEQFFDVAAVAPDDAWLVGQRQLHTTYVPIMQHWDGTAWTDARFPNSDRDGAFSEVGASGSNDVWAVGFHYTGAKTLLAHWDGTAWKSLTEFPYGGKASLASVSVLAPDDVWVAGLRDDAGPPIAVHWNGVSWKKTPVPVGDRTNQGFSTIKAFTTARVWAGGGGAYGMLAARFTGCG